MKSLEETAHCHLYNDIEEENKSRSDILTHDTRQS